MDDAPKDRKAPTTGMIAAGLDYFPREGRRRLAKNVAGLKSAAFDLTVDYLKTRNQSGQLIGTFQALQYRPAKMFTELELTRSAVEAELDATNTGAPTSRPGRPGQSQSQRHPAPGQQRNRPDARRHRHDHRHDSGLDLKRAAWLWRYMVPAPITGTATHGSADTDTG
jgi:hypothetical protein